VDVSSNVVNSKYSDHVVAKKQLYTTSQGGAWKYSVQAYISPATANTGQLGPEASIQNLGGPSS
jgi:hypothetical protein